MGRNITIFIWVDFLLSQSTSPWNRIGKCNRWILEQRNHSETQQGVKFPIIKTRGLAAPLRMQPMLIQSEWEVQIHHRQHLTSSGGIAICPKHALHQVIEAALARRVWTKFPVNSSASHNGDLPVCSMWQHCSIEWKGQWPAPIIHGRVVFIPKDTGEDLPTTD